MKDFIFVAEIAVMIIAFFVLGAECDSIVVFVLSKVTALVLFVVCAWDLGDFNNKKK